jgi:hypothetical protein
MKGNSNAISAEEKRETIRRKRKKKIIKFREKLKKRKKMVRDKLMEESDIDSEKVDNAEVRFKKTPSDKPKEEKLPKRKIKEVASKLHEATILKPISRKSSTGSMSEEESKFLSSYHRRKTNMFIFIQTYI